ncbi:(2Fe-2S)-binding protein [Marinibacterium profundimaris]|uniref:(2Fe-2S)-binding protein n=1 Tax=Marinibacterium profundimaris TaxID=1679460 RepID=UPI000B5281D9|nr:(2Fe-2S)-binding protein [Marinibacterium profundimaris]
MIICSCQRISDHDIHSAIDWMRKSDPATIITPGKIYHALGKKPDCGRCMHLFVATMRESANLEVPAILRGLKPRHREKDKAHEGRHQGHRVSQQGS